MRKALFWDCWQVLHTVGWQDFTWEQVIQQHPKWCISDINAHFSHPHELVVVFSQLVPLPVPVVASKNQTLFEIIMHRLDVLWPYRAMISQAFLGMSLIDQGQILQHVCDFFYAYWLEDCGPKKHEQEHTSDGGNHPKNPHQKRDAYAMETHAYAVYWSAVSVGVYGSVFAFAMTHTYDETLARLDKATTVFLDWLKKWHPND